MLSGGSLGSGGSGKAASLALVGLSGHTGSVSVDGQRAEVVDVGPGSLHRSLAHGHLGGKLMAHMRDVVVDL